MARPIQHWRELKGTPDGEPAVLRRRFGQTKPPYNPYIIAAGIGVELRHATNTNWSGAVKFAGDRAVIWLRDDESPQRKRFTLAHELGHLMLHGEDGRGLFRDRSFSGDPEELEANSFAAELIMPAHAVQKYISLVQFDERRLARLFGVSHEAMRVRLAILAQEIVSLRF